MPDTLDRLAATIAERREADPAHSYVAALHAKGLAKIAQKLGEEAVETVIAALGSDAAALTAEAADLLFHLLVLLDAKGLRLDQVLEELDRREGRSGIAEKAARAAEPSPAPPSAPAPDKPAPKLRPATGPAPRPRIRKG